MSDPRVANLPRWAQAAFAQYEREAAAYRAAFAERDADDPSAIAWLVDYQMGSFRRTPVGDTRAWLDFATKNGIVSATLHEGILTISSASGLSVLPRATNSVQIEVLP